jgi:hypothetical protein
MKTFEPRRTWKWTHPMVKVEREVIVVLVELDKPKEVCQTCGNVGGHYSNCAHNFVEGILQ